MERDVIRLKSRKRIIRNATLVFLGIVLLLTFFSKTINNILLPEVEYRLPWSGYLNYSIRASGEVRAQVTQKVFAQGNWHITEVLVEEGDVVSKGDILAVADVEDISLEAQRKAFELERLKNDLARYQATFRGVDLEGCENEVMKAQAVAEDAKENLDIILALFDEDVQGVIKVAQEERDRTVKECEAAYEKIQEQKTEAEKLEAEYNRMVEEKKLAISVKNREIRYFRENSEYNMPDDAYNLQHNQLRLELKRLENDLDHYIDHFEFMDITAYEKAFHQSLQAATEARENLKKKSDTYATQSEIRLRLNDAQKRYDDALRQADESIRILEQKKADAKTEQMIHTRTVYERRTEIELVALEMEQMKKYLPLDGRIVAPVDALIKSVNVEKGQACNNQQMLFEYIRSDSALSIQWTMNPAKAELLGKGDAVGFKITGEVHPLKGEVRKKEFSSENGLYLFTTDILASSNNIREGLAVEITASRSSGEYPLIVPNSSISNQSGLDYVFVLKERNGALGQEDYVEAVQVKVIESDDFHSAISGGIDPQDKIVTMSTKALENGAQVKLR